MVRGRKSRFSKPIQEIMRKGTHKTEVNHLVELYVGDDCKIEEIQACIKILDQRITGFYSTAKYEKRALTAEEFYEIKDIKSAIWKLKQIRQLKEDEMINKNLPDPELKTKCTNDLWQDICDLRDKLEWESDLTKIKEMKASLKQLYKEYENRVICVTVTREIQDADKTTTEENEGSIIGTFDSEGNTNIDDEEDDG